MLVPVQTSSLGFHIAGVFKRVKPGNCPPTHLSYPLSRKFNRSAINAMNANGTTPRGGQKPMASFEPPNSHGRLDTPPSSRHHRSEHKSTPNVPADSGRQRNGPVSSQKTARGGRQATIGSTPSPIKRLLSSPAPSVFQPAAIEVVPHHVRELYSEHSYLSQSLQKQDERANRLLERLSAALEHLPNARTPAEARKTRKDAQNIRKKIAQNTQQERSTLSRLSDLYIEIQSRERWNRVQQLQLQRQPMMTIPSLSPPPPAYYAVPPYFACPSVVTPPKPFQPTLDRLHAPFGTSRLSPLSPCFVPRWDLPRKVPVTNGQGERLKEVAQEQPNGEDKGDNGAQPVPALHWRLAAIGDDEGDLSEIRSQTCSPKLPSSSGAKARRRSSLPSLESRWPEWPGVWREFDE